MPNKRFLSRDFCCNNFPSQTARRIAVFVLLAIGVHAQNAINVSVVGATPTQVILQYTSTVDGPCAVEASESASYQPLVHDVDPILFAQSNLDSGAKHLASGRARVVVVGSRVSDTGLDQNIYSRALQANTKHYFRVNCGGTIGTAVATTANIPAGATYNDGPQIDMDQPGQ